MERERADLEEVFEYRFTRLDPVRGDHIDPPSVAIYETLLNKGADGRPTPGLATAWRISDDGLSWQLRLREGARFHTGAICDAPAVVEALGLCRWGDGLPRQVWYWDPVDTVRAIGNDVVEFRLLFPCARLPVLLWGTHTAIVNPVTWQQWGDDFGVRGSDGTGAYRLTHFSPDMITAEHVGSTPPSVPRTIRWRSVPDEDGRESLLSSASVDIVRSIPVSSVPADDSRWRIDEQPEASQFYLALSFPAGFADAALRRAIYGLIDREAVVARALGGHGHAATSPLPHVDEFSVQSPDSGEDLPTRSEALASLAALGFRPGIDGTLEREGFRLDFPCVTQDTAPFRRIAAVITEMLESAGVRLRFEFREPFEDFYRAVAAGPVSFLSKWLWQDGMEAAMGFSSSDCAEPAGGNWQRSSIPSVDSAFDDFLRASSDDLVTAALLAQRTFMTELPYLPICSPTETLAVRRDIRGFGLIPRTLYPLYDHVRLPIADGDSPVIAPDDQEGDR